MATCEKIVFLIRRHGPPDLGEEGRMPFFRSRRSLDLSPGCNWSRRDGHVPLRSRTHSSYSILWMYSDILGGMRESLERFTSALVSRAKLRSEMEMRMGGTLDVGTFNEVCLEDAAPLPPEPCIDPGARENIVRRIDAVLGSRYEAFLLVGIVDEKTNYDVWGSGGVFPALYLDVDYYERTLQREEVEFRDAHVRERLRTLKRRVRERSFPPPSRESVRFMTPIAELVSSIRGTRTAVMDSPHLGPQEEFVYHKFLELAFFFPSIEFNDCALLGASAEVVEGEAAGGSLVLFVHDARSARSTRLIDTLKPALVVAQTCAAPWTPDRKRLDLGRLAGENPNILRLLQDNRLHVMTWSLLP